MSIKDNKVDITHVLDAIDASDEAERRFFAGVTLTQKQIDLFKRCKARACDLQSKLIWLSMGTINTHEANVALLEFQETEVSFLQETRLNGPQTSLYVDCLAKAFLNQHYYLRAVIEGHNVFAIARAMYARHRHDPE